MEELKEILDRKLAQFEKKASKRIEKNISKIFNKNRTYQYRKSVKTGERPK